MRHGCRSAVVQAVDGWIGSDGVSPPAYGSHLAFGATVVARYQCLDYPGDRRAVRSHCGGRRAPFDRAAVNSRASNSKWTTVDVRIDRRALRRVRSVLAAVGQRVAVGDWSSRGPRRDDGHRPAALRSGPFVITHRRSVAMSATYAGREFAQDSCAIEGQKPLRDMV